MDTPALVALPFLIGAVPVVVWLSFTDLSRMRIPNRAVLALFALFALGGLALAAWGAWGWGDWAWRWANLAVVLVIGMALNAVGLIGAGDAKLAAVAAPFVAVADLGTVLMLYAGMVLAAWILHRIAKHSFGPRLWPDWKSWTSGKRFPMGVAIGATLIAYLGLAAAA